MRVKVGDFYVEHEDLGTRQPLLFIHGYPLNRTLWDPQVNELADVARVLAPDLRGHGGSDALPGPYSMELLADDCRAFLDAMRVTPPVVLCGLSMGGYVAFAFFRKYPERVAGLILAATRASADTPEGKANRDQAIALAKEKGVAAIAESLLPKMLSPKTYSTRPELVARVKAMMESAPLAGVLGDLAGLRDRPDSTPTLTRIDRPTLILHGADDQIIPVSQAEAMHAAIKGSRLQIIPDAGHLLNLEQPGGFNAAVREFIEHGI
jgi:pimeloyl-ACP methyl ester carboxylesterase